MPDRATMKLYLKYVIPSTFAFLLEGVYSIVDGLFVGHMVGDAGLGGVNVAWPLVALVMAVGTGIGMGGAVISSIREGEGAHDKARHTMAHTLLMLVMATIPLMLILLPFGNQLLSLIGGSGETLNQATKYLAVMGWGVFFQVMATGCVPLIRNKGGVIFAMIIMALGGVLNCFFDWLMVFVLETGVQGAAIATIASQVFVFICGVFFFMLKRNRFKGSDFKLEGALVIRTLKLAVAPFALTLLPEFTTVVMNVSCRTWGGETAVAAFAVISYTAVPVQWIIQGISDGAQPLVSKCFGAGDGKTVHALRRVNYVVAMSLGLIGTVALYLFRPQLAVIFGISPQATEIFFAGMALFGLVFVFYGFTHVTTSFFYAIESNANATVIIVGEVVLMVLFAWILPQFLALDGVWLVVVVTQVVLCAIGGILLVRSEESLRRRTQAEYDKGTEHASLETLS